MKRDVPDGIYDVRYCGYRELVKSGKVVKCAKSILYLGPTRDRRSKEWGEYPDIPEINSEVNEALCPYCQGVKVLIDRMNHSRFYDCPLCRGTGKYNATVQ